MLLCAVFTDFSYILFTWCKIYWKNAIIGGSRYGRNFIRSVGNETINIEVDKKNSVNMVKNNEGQKPSVTV